MGDHDQTVLTGGHAHVDDMHASIHNDGRTIQRLREDEFLITYDEYANPVGQVAPSNARLASVYYGPKLAPDSVYIHPESFLVTEWESLYSSVFEVAHSPFSAASFVPVVDDGWRVVGHIGWADGNDIIVPEHTVRNDRHFWSVLQKMRLDEWRQQLLKEADKFDRGPFPNSPFPRPATSAPPNDGKRWRGPENCVPRRPTMKLDTMWDEARRGPLKETDMAQWLHDLDRFVSGGGRAFVGRHFVKHGDASYLPLYPGIPDGEVGSPKKPYSSGYDILVLVDPEGNLKRVIDIRKMFTTQVEHDIKIVLELVDLAMTIMMVIDIVPIAVVLFRWGLKLAARATIRAITLVVDQEAKALLKLAERETAKILRAGAMSGPGEAEAKTAWDQLRKAFWDAGKSPPQKIHGMSKDEIKAWNKKIAERMKKLGIPENNIGVRKRAYDPISGELLSDKPIIASENGEALNTSNFERGGNMRSFHSEDEVEELGISVHSNVFDNWQGFDLWNKSSVEDRIDAVIAHEWSEFNELSHWETVELAPETRLPVSPRARELLEEMAKWGNSEKAFTEFSKNEWQAIKAAGKENASFAEKMKAAKAATAITKAPK
jgi:hypothetical protein